MGGTIRRFEDLKVWQEAMGIVREVYSCLKTCKDFGLRNHIQPSAVSIPSNIAEGFERGTNKEFIRYLLIAKGSCGELRTQLYLVRDLGYIDMGEGIELLERARILSSMIYRLAAVRKERF